MTSLSQGRKAGQLRRAGSRGRRINDAAQPSVVWYSQKLTTQLGEKDFARYVEMFDYGNKDVSGDLGLNNGLTHAWLLSSLSISAEEQIAFLHKVLNRRFPLKARAYEMTASIIPTYSMADGWIAHGKSGSGWQRGQDGRIDMERKQGWFVGWATKGTRTVLFTRLILDEAKIASHGGVRARDSLLQDFPGLLKNKGIPSPERAWIKPKSYPQG